MQLRFVASTFMLWIALHPDGASALCKGDPIQNIVEYEGTMGDKYRIKAVLDIKDSTITGVYFYATQLKDISLKGSIVEGSRLVLDELDAAGKTVARFEGVFAETDPRKQFTGPLQCEVITGSWQKIGATDKLPFFLSMATMFAGDLHRLYIDADVDEDETLNRSAQRFWEAVRKGSNETVASFIEYPIKVHLGDRIKRIASRQELLGHYDEIFFQQFRTAIDSDFPRAMMCHLGDGCSLGRRGEVWFDGKGKVIALNNEPYVEPVK
jgi:hypothetical protein